ncbi:PorV/PorQ family protein [bacterium]|nr:PorV/PorQ family protein [bacterium]
MYHHKRFCICMTFCVLHAFSIYSQTRDQIFVGARPMAMGETFAGIADDGNAQYWNPAGLPHINHYEINSMHADLFNTDIKNNYFAFMVPFTDRIAVGLDWFNIGFDDDELGYSQNKFDLSLAYKVSGRISIGSNIRHFRTETRLDGMTEADGTGWGADLGLLYLFSPNWRIGIMAHDLIETTVHYNGGGSDKIYGRNLRFGASYKPFPELLVATDVDDRIHLGSEYQLFDLFALRAGFQKDLVTRESPTYSLGAGFKWQFIKIDYAYTLSPVLENTSRFSVGFYFNLFPSKVRIQNIRVNEIFPSQYKHYIKRPFGTVSLINISERPIQTKLSVFVPKIMDEPTDTTIIVRPKITDDYDLKAVISDVVLDIHDDVASQVSVEVSYKTERKTYSDKYSTPLIIYNKNAIQWAEGVASAASFITTTSDGVQRFSRQSLIDAQTEYRTFADDKLIKAINIFNALHLYGIQYIEDPYSPYSIVSTTKKAVDNIQYPVESLSRKAGDCDDLTVLYAAMLECVGIETALLDVPGHLFLMLNTEVLENQQLAFGLDPMNYVVYQGMVWIPIEVTLIDQSFYKAWHSGIEKYYQYHDLKQIKIVPVHQAWQGYPAVHVDADIESVTLNPSMLSQKIQSDINQIRHDREEFIDSRILQLSLSDEEYFKRSNELGIYYALSGRKDEASQIFSTAKKRIPNAAVTNNLGNTYMIQNMLDSALVCYQKSLELDPEDGGTYVNMGITLLLSGDTLYADRMFSEAVKHYKNLVELYNHIGISEEKSSRQKGKIEDPNEAVLVMKINEVKSEEKTGLPSLDMTSILDNFSESYVRGKLSQLLTLDQIEKNLYWKFN